MPQRGGADRAVAEVRAGHADLGPDQDTGEPVRLAGELTGIRRHGGLSFARLRDDTGEIQLFAESGTLGRQAHHDFGALEPGDRLRVDGTVMTTRRGELSVRVTGYARVAAPAGVATVPTPGAARVQVTAPSVRPAGASAVVAPRVSRSGHGAASALVSPAATALGSPAAPALEVPAPPPPPTPSRADEVQWPVRAIAGLTALNGLLELLVLLPVLHPRLDRIERVLDPDWFVVVNRFVEVLIGVGLLLLAGQLAKRKRTAWPIALALFAAGTAAHLWRGPLLAAGANLLMVVALLATRRRFRAAPDPPSLLRLARFLPTYLAGVLAFGVGSLFVERAALIPEFSLGAAVGTVLGGLVGLGGDYLYLHPRFGAYFEVTLLAFGLVGMAVLVTLVFRPLRARGPHTETDWRHASRLVHQHGWDTLAYFALRDDKSFFFGSDGQAMLAYTYSGGYALVAGDPIGSPESVGRLLDEFLRMCDERAWNPAFLAIRQAEFPSYAARGFHGFYLGDEAILRCDRFDLAAAPKSVRAAVRRVGRGYRFQLIPEAAATGEMVDELNAISARWRGKAPERGFTMSLSQDVRGAGANPDFLLCVALDEHDRPGGFLRLVPAYGHDPGYTLDLMRRDPAAPNGMTEFLVVHTAAALGAQGVVRFSMNFAMWGRLFAEDVRFTPAERVARRLVTLLNPYFQIRSLRRFNAKFDPDWLPRMLAYRRPTDLPRVGLLYAAAEGFLAIPVIGDLLVPKAVGGVGSPSAPPAPSADQRRTTTGAPS